MALLAAEPAEAPSLVVAGPVGVGKSRLVADFLARAGAEGVATVLVRATRSTATIPFGPFAPWAPDGQGVGAADRLGVLRALSTSLVGEHEQLVVAVDDAHLLDDGSAALVLHLAANTPARVVVTLRTGELCPDAVTALWKDGLAERIDLQALSEAETAELVERALGGPVDQAARRRLWSLTEGVPLYLREVVRAALDQGVLAREGRHWHWRGALAGSDRLQGLMRDHLAQAGPDERRLLELLAVGEPLPWVLVDRLGTAGAVHEAVAHGFVAGDDSDGPGDGPTLRLAHPLYGELLRADVPALAARGHQAALAEAALVTGWHHHDPLRVAVWGLDGGAPLDAPGLLTAAARRALHLSEWALAERLATAAGGEPEAIITRALSLAPQARADEASVLLAGLAIEALNGEIDEAVAGEAARVHSWLVYGRPGPTPTVADAVAAAERLPTPVRAVALVHCGFQSVLWARPDDAAALAELAGDGVDDTSSLGVMALAVVALARAVQGRTAEAIAAAEAGLPRVAAILAADPVPGNPVGGMPIAYCLGLVLDGRLDEAAAVADLVLAATDGGARAVRALAATLAGRMALFRGRLDEARSRGELGLSLCRETGQLPAAHWPAAVLASAAAQLGDPATAAWALDGAAAASGSTPLYAVEADLARGWEAAARGEASAARARAAATADTAAAAGMHALTLLALLDLARFGAPAPAAARLAELASRVDGRFAAAVTAYAGAVAAGDSDALAAASGEFEAMGAILLAAEAAAGAAATLAAAGRRASAAAALGRARTLAARCDGARTPALRDLGTDRAVAALTDREREVAELAARGLTNREIADRLYVSVRTVTTHLYRVYAKLGINERDQLGLLLDAG
jgi:DNA-binding CsgD family transcriptional regulator